MQATDDLERQITEAVAKGVVHPEGALASYAEPLDHVQATHPTSVFARASWGMAGFLIGAAFWHFIGFWNFVSEVVFVGHSVRAERLVDQAGALCVQLALDRETGVVSDQRCPVETPLLNEGALAIRGDFAGEQWARSLLVKPSIRISDGAR